MRTHTGYLYDDRFLEHVLSPLHPESAGRLMALHATIAQSPLYGELALLAPLADEKKTLETIALVHSRAHIDEVRQCPNTGNAATLAVAGTLAAIEAVCTGEVTNAFCALRPPGHHAHDEAHRDGRCQGEGFCFFNNVAIGARYAQKNLGVARVLIIDWDFHHGNGTEETFYADPTVFFFSTHRLHAYPGTGHPNRTGSGAGKGYTLNVPLPAFEDPYGKVTDEHLLSALSDRLFPQLDALQFRPDLILISAGFDGRIGDTLGDMAITDAGFSEATRLVMEYSRRTCAGQIVSVLEGGYDPIGLALAGLAHVRALREG